MKTTAVRAEVKIFALMFVPFFLFSVKQRFVETIFVAVFFPFIFFVNLEKQSLIHFEITELKGFLKYVCCATSQRWKKYIWCEFEAPEVVGIVFTYVILWVLKRSPVGGICQFPRVFFNSRRQRAHCRPLRWTRSLSVCPNWNTKCLSQTSRANWAMKKPWLFRVYRGLYHPVMWGA